MNTVQQHHLSAETESPELQNNTESLAALKTVHTEALVLSRLNVSGNTAHAAAPKLLFLSCSHHPSLDYNLIFLNKVRFVISFQISSTLTQCSVHIDASPVSCLSTEFLSSVFWFHCVTVSFCLFLFLLFDFLSLSLCLYCLTRVFSLSSSLLSPSLVYLLPSRLNMLLLRQRNCECVCVCVSCLSVASPDRSELHWLTVITITTVDFDLHYIFIYHYILYVVLVQVKLLTVILMLHHWYFSSQLSYLVKVIVQINSIFLATSHNRAKQTRWSIKK